MSREDAGIVFSNVPELAEFADDFVTHLEIALGDVLPSGEGEGRVRALFIKMGDGALTFYDATLLSANCSKIPRME